MTAARVIGAGLSGLVAAWHLVERGFAVTVSERAARPGGLIHTASTAHGLVETAANAFVLDDTVAAWFQRLDLAPVSPAALSKRRYIFRDGRARRWPLSLAESAAMAGRLGARFITRSTGARDGETMAAWGHRVVGRAATRWLIEPAMNGIYASPPEALSAAAIFGGRRRGSRRMVTPAGGMGQFTTRLHEQLTSRGVRFEWGRDITAIDDGTPTVVCTGASDAARLLAPHAPSLGRAIAAVRVLPLTTVTMFFEPHPADRRGFGLLFPSGSGVHGLGVLFNADIFDHRSTVRSETWIVGDRDAGITAWSDQQLGDALAADRRLLTGRSQSPLAVHVTRWPQAIPVYNDAIARVQHELSTLPPWLAVTGNYLGRIGVAALLDLAAAAAGRLR